MKLQGPATCPGCGKDHDVSFDLDKLKEDPIEVLTPTIKTDKITTTNQEIKPEIKIKTVSPQDEPFYKCKNGNCGKGAHPNPNYKIIPKEKCENCGTLNGQKVCKNCGNKDEDNFNTLDQDELNDLGIPLPKEEEHDHDHED